MCLEEYQTEEEDLKKQKEMEYIIYFVSHTAQSHMS